MKNAANKHIYIYRLKSVGKPFQDYLIKMVEGIPICARRPTDKQTDKQTDRYIDK